MVRIAALVFVPAALAAKVATDINVANWYENPCGVCTGPATRLFHVKKGVCLNTYSGSFKFGACTSTHVTIMLFTDVACATRDYRPPLDVTFATCVDVGGWGHQCGVIDIASCGSMMCDGDMSDVVPVVNLACEAAATTTATTTQANNSSNKSSDTVGTGYMFGVAAVGIAAALVICCIALVCRMKLAKDKSEDDDTSAKNDQNMDKKKNAKKNAKKAENKKKAGSTSKGVGRMHPPMEFAKFDIEEVDDIFAAGQDVATALVSLDNAVVKKVLELVDVAKESADTDDEGQQIVLTNSVSKLLSEMAGEAISAALPSAADRIKQLCENGQIDEALSEFPKILPKCASLMPTLSLSSLMHGELEVKLPAVIANCNGLQAIQELVEQIMTSVPASLPGITSGIKDLASRTASLGPTDLKTKAEDKLTSMNPFEQMKFLRAGASALATNAKLVKELSLAVPLVVGKVKNICELLLTGFQNGVRDIMMKSVSQIKDKLTDQLKEELDGVKDNVKEELVAVVVLEACTDPEDDPQTIAAVQEIRKSSKKIDEMVEVLETLLDQKERHSQAPRMIAKSWKSLDFGQWLAQVDGGKGFLAQYKDSLEANYDDLGQVIDLYVSRDDAGKPVLDMSFYDEIGAEKAGHRKLIERWVQEHL